jgi:hypothetical protein
MRAIETVCRALAEVVCRSTDEDWNADRLSFYIEKHWQEHEHAAKDLLRSLKRQPPHVTDAGGLDEMLSQSPPRRPARPASSHPA